MKKVLSLFLALSFLLASVGCVSRTQAKPDEPNVDIETPETNDNSEPQSDQPEVSDTHILESPEEISEVLSITSDLLTKADECNLVYTGKITLNSDPDPQSIDGDDIFLLTDSKLLSTNDIESLWLTTFVPDGKAKEIYDNMTKDMRYVSINGQLYVKEYLEDIPPMTMGNWDLESAVIKEVTSEKIVVNMQTKLVGQENGIKSLELINVDDHWLLTDSYFLD